MTQVNDLILKLASLQAAILINANVYEDDLQDSWDLMKGDYENVKKAMDNYIKNGEQ
jgi:hypothetical protein